MTTPQPSEQVQPVSPIPTGPYPPQYTPPPPAGRIPAWLVVGAGAVAVIASFLPWINITAPLLGSISAAGTDGTDGWATVGAGALLVLYGALALRGPLATVFKVLAAVASLGLSGFAVYHVVDLHAREAQMRAQMAAQPDDSFGFGSALASAVQVRVGVGLWLIVLAGLVGTAATGYTLLKRDH